MRLFSALLTCVAFTVLVVVPSALAMGPSWP